MGHYARLKLFVILLDFISTVYPSRELFNKEYYSRQRRSVDDFMYFEEVRPIVVYQNQERQSTLNRGEHLHDIVIYLQAFNKTIVVDLKLNKHSFSKSFIVKTYDEKGAAVVEKQPLKFDKYCYYNGKISGKPYTTAAITTCNGISGLIIDSDELYHIEPMQGSISGKHRLFRDSDRRRHSHKCGNYNNHTISHFHPASIYQRKKRSVHPPYDSNDKTRYVEMFLVYDNTIYQEAQRRAQADLASRGYDANSIIKEAHIRAENHLVSRSEEIINIVNSLYRPLNIYVTLVGVEIWTRHNQIQIQKKPDDTLELFLQYRMQRINPFHQNDNAQLITAQEFDEGVVGKAKMGPICTNSYSGGVNRDYNELITPVATTVAHELGHNFGMEHDGEACTCVEQKCIMSATIGQNNPTKWSSCSKEKLTEALEMGMDYCLRNIPYRIYNDSTGRMCGNGFTEPGEDCDCGLPQDCKNKCCDARTCRFHQAAQCATGKCCNLQTCKLKPRATKCRSATGECDLDEYCNGTSEYCPRDVYKENGLECKDSKAYCYQGQCNTKTDQCELLWGSTGRVSDPFCFQKLNKEGKGSGNCGYNWTTEKYTPCEREDVMCGLLHCVHLNEKLMFWNENYAIVAKPTFLTVGTTRYVCRSIMLDVGLDMPDPGMVPDGTKCGNNRMCINHTCLSITKIKEKTPQCLHSCNNGVCNSNGNCHCDAGYAPPLCTEEGYGGSMDSGPASDQLPDNHAAVIGVMVSLLIIALVIVAYCSYRHQDQLKRWWKQNKPSFKYSMPSKPPRPTRPPKSPPIAVRHPRSPPSATRKPRSPIVARQPRSPPAQHKNGPATVKISTPVLNNTTNRNKKITQKSVVSTPPTSPIMAPSKPKRRPESMREISHPTFISSTNRHSSFVDGPEICAVSDDELTTTVHPEFTTSTVPKRNKVRRSQSERPPTRPPLPQPPSMHVRTNSDCDRPSHVETAVQNTRQIQPPRRPLPPEPRSKPVIYANDPTAPEPLPSTSFTKPRLYFNVDPSTGKPRIYPDGSDSQQNKKVTFSDVDLDKSDDDESDQVTSVAAIRAKFNNDSGSPRLGTSLSRNSSTASDRPLIPPKPGVRSVKL